MVLFCFSLFPVRLVEYSHMSQPVMALTFNIVLLQLYQFALLKFWISEITCSLVNGSISYSHTVLLRLRPFHQHATI